MSTAAPHRHWLRSGCFDWIPLVLLKAALTWWVLRSGLRAISDDDFARVVISQDFAQTPRLDPSGTSWLPFPFWVQGAVMRWAGTDLDVARITCWVTALLASTLPWIAARWLGLSRWGALLAGAAAASLPYGLWLGAAAVPDYPTAALLLLAWASVVPTNGDTSPLDDRVHHPAPRRLLVGALALLLATLSRYEAWPIAVGFSVFCLLELRPTGGARRADRVAVALALGLALLGPVAWMTHGALAHGDALFFVKRVSAYRRALGAGTAGWQWVTHYPMALLRFEPEVAGAALVALVGSLLSGQRARLRAHARPLILAAMMLGFLMWGELRDGAATHHAERAVLTLWLWFALFAVDLGLATLLPATLRVRALLLGALGLVLLVTAALLRPHFGQVEAFAARRDEVTMGRRARRLLSADARLAIHTTDYGYFAVMAGFGGSRRAEPLIDHDPRHAPTEDPLTDAATLRAVLQERGLSWVVLTGPAVSLAPAVGAYRDSTWDFVLVQLLAMSAPPPPQGR